jgi:hypothetical protein
VTPRGLNSPPTYTIVIVAVAGGLIFYFSNLETVPVSGRTRFNVYGAESVRRAGEMEMRRLLYELESRGVHLLPAWDPRVARVRRVMQRLIPFSGMAGEDWEVFVVDDPRVANAFVLPGGKVFVFSGILGLTGGDSGLATVLGHEIAHNLAGHFGERLSQDIGASIVLYSLVVLGGVFGLGPLILHFFGSRFLDVAFGFPMSRLQESEADYIGLMMMAEACYDPAEAVSFWARMERATGGHEVPEWMSTHPAVCCFSHLFIAHFNSGLGRLLMIVFAEHEQDQEDSGVAAASHGEASTERLPHDHRFCRSLQACIGDRANYHREVSRGRCRDIRFGAWRYGW